MGEFLGVGREHVCLYHRHGDVMLIGQTLRGLGGVDNESECRSFCHIVRGLRDVVGVFIYLFINKYK